MTPEKKVKNTEEEISKFPKQTTFNEEDMSVINEENKED